MIFEKAGEPLRLREVPVPHPGPGQILIRIEVCGVCRTDLHIIDGELASPKLPLIPGHEIVGTVAALGPQSLRFKIGDAVGVPWLGSTDGECRYCRRGQENLCENALFTGYTLDGGYAEFTVADERFCLPLPDGYRGVSAAPLLCAGLIGYRSYRMAGDRAERLGFFGFGASAHILIQLAAAEGRQVYAFTRPGDTETQSFARRLGAVWAGDSTTPPPETLDAAIIFAPVGALVLQALSVVDRGGTVVCAGIHMSDIPAFPYRLLWGERVVRSVANLTRRDGEDFMAAIVRTPVRTAVQVFPLEAANEALNRLRGGQIEGAAVLKINEPV